MENKCFWKNVFQALTEVATMVARALYIQAGGAETQLSSINADPQTVRLLDLIMAERLLKYYLKWRLEYSKHCVLIKNCSHFLAVLIFNFIFRIWLTCTSHFNFSLFSSLVHIIICIASFSCRWFCLFLSLEICFLKSFLYSL